MKKVLALLILLCAVAFAQQKQRIAVLPSVGDLEPQGLILLTDKVREIATQHLPMESFNILKQDVITKLIGEEELYRACKEGVCIGDLARKTNANYGARCDVIKFNNKLILKFELYSVNDDAIFETFTDYKVKDFYGMLALLETRLPKTFQKLLNASKPGLPKPLLPPESYKTYTAAAPSGTTFVDARDDKVGIDMIFVQGGTFTMGCTREQGGDCYDEESPAHSVTVGSFSIGKYEVTQGQWKAVMGSNPSHFKGDNLPVETVSWNDVQEFIQKLNSMTGKKYRLPTEAEWEYAARGGNKSRGYKYSGGNNIGGAGWYAGNSGDRPLDNAAMARLWSSQKYDEYAEKITANSNRTRPVGTKTANELGIHDMSGNVYEWVSDWYGSYSSSSVTNPKGPGSGSYRVNRGGSWNSVARNCRVSNRPHGPDGRYYFLGFRLAVSP